MSTDVEAFWGAAGDFLEAGAVEHTVLLTEAAYLRRRPDVAEGARFGWWRPGGRAVEAVFLRAPRHAPELSVLDDATAVGALADALPELSELAVDARNADTIKDAWERRGVELAPRQRRTLYRLTDFRPPEPPPGRARPATIDDRPLLIEWYEQLMARFPDDRSDLAYVVDEPLADGGLTLWEVDGAPVAMAGRTKVVAGMTRVGGVHAPHNYRHGDAALAAACATAAELAEHVLTF